MKIKSNGIELHYAVEGSGPWVVMSHSLACDASMWDEQARALRGHYRVLRFDTRGHGRTSAPPGPYTLEQMAEDLHGLLSGLGIAETHFVGISMGGMIGQVFALTYPTLVRSLILCDTTSRYPAEAWPIWEERIRIVESTGMEPLVEPTLQRWFTAPFRERRQEVMDRVVSWLTAAPQPGPLTHAGQATDDDNSGASSGDGDGLVEPGETIELGLTLANAGDAAASGVTATISTDNGYVTISARSDSGVAYGRFLYIPPIFGIAAIIKPTFWPKRSRRRTHHQTSKPMSTVTATIVSAWPKRVA